MKVRRKILLGVLALALIGAVWLIATPSRARRQLESTRRALRQQGFKVDLSEFDLSITEDQRKRGAQLATTTRAAMVGFGRNLAPLTPYEFPELLTPATRDSAIVLWSLPELKNYRSGDLWSDLRNALDQNRPHLDNALAAALSGPIRFEPIGRGSGALLPYLADLRNLERAFGLRMLLALHDGQRDVAWTNLLGATCLATAYLPEPIDICHLVRLACSALAFEAAWNALQAGTWTDAQLADLQRRWETVDYWKDLPETIAYRRASIADAFQAERAQSVEWGLSLGDTIKSPRQAWWSLRSYAQRTTFRNHGSYEIENAWLLYSRDLEVNLRKALGYGNWTEMRLIPGVVNSTPFIGRGPSSVLAMMNSRQLSLTFQSGGQGPFGRTATEESQRRLLITAVALERFHLKQHHYPANLNELVPAFLTSLPVDFIDGKPLRYRQSDDGHFVLYSVGLDGADNGGKMKVSEYPSSPPRPVLLAEIGFDLVWPRPATQGEAEQLLEHERQLLKLNRTRGEEAEADAWWQHTMHRQAKFEKILSTPLPELKPVTYKGRPLEQWLRNEQESGTNQLKLSELLSLKPVITGAEPEVVTFELPIRFDALTNIGTLALYIDPTEDDDSDEGCAVAQVECTRATNGNCLLAWNTIYECPGKHALAAGVDLNDENSDQEIVGPLITCELTNLCQFSPASAHFEREHGITLRARLAEPEGQCVIDFYSPEGNLLATRTQKTTNHLVTFQWDLLDQQQRLCTNDVFNTIVHVTLAKSGRSQALKGP